jgi:ribosomal protein S18 acetylase RimI-like enzyme
MSGISITKVGPERIDELVAFWLLLHATQGATARTIDGIPLRDGADSGKITRDLYLTMLRDPDGFAFIAESADEAVGYLVAVVTAPSEIWNTGRIGYIDSLYVRPELRGQGIGLLMLRSAYSELRRRGVKTAALDIVCTNEGAIRFYEREGFTPTMLHMYHHLPAEREPPITAP